MKIVKAFFLFLTLSAIAFASDSQFDTQRAKKYNLLGISEAPKPLMKSGSTSLTYYKSTVFNMEYTSPAGWSFTEGNISSGPNGISIMYEGSASDALRWLFISGFKYGTKLEAEGLGYKIHLQHQKNVFDYTITKAPLVYSLVDTTMSDVHYIMSKIKDNERGLIMVTYTASNSIYVQSVNYLTTLADWELNENRHKMHWNNLLFLTTTGGSAIAKRTSEPTLRRDKGSVVIVNALGKVTGISPSERKFHTFEIPLR